MARNLELEQLILANLDDPEPYLVYADWLTAHGDPRGELIALQHRTLSESENGNLLGAAARLLTFNQSLTPELDPWYARFKWKRGFIDRAELDNPTSDQLELALDHPACVVLRQLAVNASYQAAPQLLATLAADARPTIESLAFEQESGEGEQPELGNDAWRQLPGLRELSISGSGLFEGIVHPGLRSLVIEHDPFAHDPNTPWNLPCVERVKWIAARVDSRLPLRRLVDAHAPALRELDLTQWEGTSRGAGIWFDDAKFVRLVGQLEILSITLEYLRRDPSRAIAFVRERAPRLAHLRELRVDAGLADEDELDSLARELPNLRY